MKTCLLIITLLLCITTFAQDKQHLPSDIPAAADTVKPAKTAAGNRKQLPSDAAVPVSPALVVPAGRKSDRKSTASALPSGIPAATAPAKRNN